LGGALAGLLPDVANHRLASDVLQRLAGQAAGGVAGGNDDGESLAHLSRRSSTLRVRASPSSITGMPSRTGKAKASARQINTDLSSASLSGPLHSGQARISSNFGSIGESLGQERPGSKRASCASSQATKAAEGAASTARYHQSAAAKARHLTASFSVITSGSGGLKASCAALYRAWSAKACGIGRQCSASRVSKKRCGLPIPATACNG